MSVAADETETHAGDNVDREQSVATLANLSVRTLAAPAAVSPGATFTMQDTTQNGGAIGATVTRFYLSSDSRKDSGDIILNAGTVPALAKKQSHTASTPVTIDGLRR